MRPEETITVRLLGPVELLGSDGVPVDVPSSSQRRLLAVLALHAPGAVRSGWLCEMLDVTSGALRTSVARLRRVAGPRLVRTSAGGYRLDASVDAHLACEEIHDADGDPDRLVRALDRWVGWALAEFRDERWAVGDARRLDEVRATAIEDLAEVHLERGNPGRAIGDLMVHVAEYPYRDRPRGLLIRALAASGRQPEALRAFRDYRELLGDAVGIEPTDHLRAIEQRIATGWRGVDPSNGRDPERPAPKRRDAVLDDEFRMTATGVGRRAALNQLADAVDRTIDKGSGAVLVSGEVGIGKTSLVAEFARAAVLTHGWELYYGRCDELVGSPFQPFPSIVGRLVDQLSDIELQAHRQAPRRPRPAAPDTRRTILRSADAGER